jgi:hypothetical protein
MDTLTEISEPLTAPARKRISWHVFTRGRPLVGMRIVLPFVDGYSYAARKFDAALLRLARRVATGEFSQRRLFDKGPAYFEVAFEQPADADRLVALIGGERVDPSPEGWGRLFLRKADPSICRQILALAGLTPAIPGATPWSMIEDGR